MSFENDRDIEHTISDEESLSNRPAALQITQEKNYWNIEIDIDYRD